MKFNIDGEQKEIFINGKKINKLAKKAKLSDRGVKLDEAVKSALVNRGRKKDETS